MTKKSLLFFICSIFTWAIIHAQKTVLVSGTLIGQSLSKIYFRQYTGSKATYTDSLYPAGSHFQFQIPDSIRGLCNITTTDPATLKITLITTGENIVFTSNYFHPIENMRIIVSEENKLYYKYLQQAAALIPQKKEPATPLTQFAMGSKGSLALLYYRLQVPVSTPGSSLTPQQYQKEHFLDNTDFSNTNIIHTDLLLPKIFAYIALFDNGFLPFNEQADTLCFALDRLLSRAARNEVVYNFLVEDFSNRFRYGNYDIICAYLTKFYASKFSVFKNLAASDVRLRLNSLVHPTIGQTSPEIVMEQPGGGFMKMSSIKSDYTLIVFWSTYCNHCMQSLPLLKRIYDAGRGNFEVLAVSFDTDRAAWQKFIQDNNLGWLNYSDLLGWESKIAHDYDVQGTPTYFLLDKNKKIIAKPIELTDLASELQRLKII